MQAGKLRNRITIESASTAQNEYGESAGAWDTVLSCWAAINAVTGREVYVAGAGFTGELTHKVTIRYTSKPVTAGMRVRYRDRIFLVQGPPQNVNERDRQMDLLCLEQTE